MNLFRVMEISGSALLAERHAWESRGHRVVGLIDDHPRFAEGGSYLDLPVWSVRAVERRVAASWRR